VDETAQRHPRHVGNIAVTKVTTQREYCGNPANVRFAPKADMICDLS
jgi:hypothetical protein